MRKIITAFMMLLCAVCMASAANYLTFTAEEDGSTFGIVNNGGNNPDIQYSLDGGETWTALAAGDTITLAHKGDKALLKGNNPEGFSNPENYSSFTMTGKVAASGSVMSLIDGVGLSTEIPNGYCFCKLFRNCTSLTQAPALSATTLSEWCYWNMFSGCTSLTQAPELPATTLAEACYSQMFASCTSLTQAPELPATTLPTASNVESGCYGYMFSGCTSLTQAPALPATTLAEFCYLDMFSGCTNLTQAPALPATTLAEGCYAGMFYACTSLTQAPKLPATTLADNCYRDMFMRCTSLSEINVSFTSWSNSGTAEWVENVAPTGTFICPKALPLEYGEGRIPDGWTVKYIDDTVAVETNYLTFTAEEDGSTFGIINEGGNNPDIQYSLDGGETWAALAAGDTVTLAHKGDKALLRGDNPEGFSKGYDKYSSFTMTGKIAASGSVMSLIDGTGLSTEIPNSHCFFGLFEYCSGLTQAPELPATTLAEACYSFMFAGCTSLTQAPELPATTLVGLCYNCIFVRCESLSQIRVSFDEWSDAFTGDWVVSVAPTGTFICPKALPLEYGEGRIPDGWTVKYIDDTVAVETNYLTFTAEEDGSTFGIINEGGNNPDIQYSLDGGKTWTALAAGDTVTLAHKGDKALLRGDNPEGFSKGKYEFSTFKLTGKVAASGSVMSLIDGVGISTEIPGEFCFRAMFLGCTSLTQAPELPATILADNCYWGMFYHCTSLTQAPELPATTLAEGCYYEMFSGCTSLSEIKVPFDDWNRGHYTAEWVIDVAPTGTFICPKTLALEYGWESIPEGWTVKYIDDTVAVETNYLTFTAEEDGSTFGIINEGGNNPDIQYSLDGGETWTALAAGDTITLAHKGDKALLRGDNPEGFSKGDNKYSSFTMTGKIAVSGSVMSLIDGTGETLVVPADYCFYSLFKGCTSLTQTPELPATTLADACYAEMFKGCASLTQAPELPATALADNCYYGMFSGCKSLTQTPKLLATTLVSGCYSEMFLGCTSLTQAPELPATTLVSGCYSFMFYGCTSLTQAPELPATTLVSGCYSFMFLGCTSLTQAPELPATTLAVACYHFMFSGCTSLTQAPELPATTLAESCYEGMFYGCTSLTQAPELPATTLAEACYDGMFEGCTSLTQAPELPATTLAIGCYQEMFDGCTSLTQAPELPATALVGSCYAEMFTGCTNLSEIHVSFDDWLDPYSEISETTTGWVYNVAPTGTFICPKALALEYGEDRIPEGWTVKYIEDGSGVNTTLVDNISVWSDDLTVYVRGAEGEVSLYDMSGRIVATSNSADEERALCVPSKGVYVVRTNNGTSDVLVR